VGDDNARKLQLLLQLLDQIAEQLGHERVDHGGRLVIQNTFGLGGQGAGNCHRALHPGGKIGRQLIAHFANPDHLQKSVHDLIDFGLGQVAALAQGECHVLTHSQGIEQRAVLEHHGDFFVYALQFRFAGMGYVFVSHDDAARIWLQKSHNLLQSDRLAYA
jgi:hypothetical protein